MNIMKREVLYENERIIDCVVAAIGRRAMAGGHRAVAVMADEKWSCFAGKF